MTEEDERSGREPDRHCPSWFWELLDQGEHSPAKFRSLCQALPKLRLAEFIEEYSGLASFFTGMPFALHLADAQSVAIWASEGTLDEVARLIVSRGKQEVMRVWNQPEEFGVLYRAYLQEPRPSKAYPESFGWIAEEVWDDRFGDEDWLDVVLNKG